MNVLHGSENKLPADHVTFKSFIFARISIIVVLGYFHWGHSASNYNFYGCHGIWAQAARCHRVCLRHKKLWGRKDSSRSSASSRNGRLSGFLDKGLFFIKPPWVLIRGNLARFPIQ